MNRPKHPSGRPTLQKEAVLAFLAAHPGAGKRDLARALGVKGPERQALKDILHTLKDEGVIEQSKRRSFVQAGNLPEVTVLEIFGEDADGEPIARPTHWEREDPAPSILVLPGRDSRAPPPGRGDKILAQIGRAHV